MATKPKEGEGKGEQVEIKDFDDVLQYIGGWGPFQYVITLAFFPFNFFLGYVYLSPILTLFPPPHWCRVPELSHLSMEERRELAIPRDALGGFEQCSQYLVDWSQAVNRTGGQAGNLSWGSEDWAVQKTGPCTDGWEYDTITYHRSIVSDLDWVCGLSWVPALSQSIFFLGAVPGMLFFGWLSDNHGRVPAILCSNLVALLSGLTTPFATSYISFCVLRFIMGFSFNAFFIVPYTLAIEYVAESKRTLVGNLGLALCLTLSGVYQPWLVKYLGDWRVFNWIIFAQMGLVVLVPLVMPESCRWLMSRGEGERTVAIMARIARMNGRQVTEEVNESVRALCEKQKQENATKASLGYLDLFRTPDIRRITLLMIILWMLISLEFDCTVRNITNLDFNIYYSFMISAALEFPADMLSIVGLEKLGRRWSASLSMFMVGACTLPCAWLTEMLLPQAVFAMAGRFFATYAMNTGFQFTVEVLPTNLRGQGMAVVHLMSMLAQMASPLIVYTGELSEKAPYLIIAFLGFIGAVPGLFLPETAGVSLPENLEEMKTFGKKDRFLWLPILGAGTRHRADQVNQAGEERAGEELSSRAMAAAGPRDNLAFSPN